MDKAKHLCEWLDGKWLEHYVYQIIQQIKKDKPDTRLGVSAHPQSEQNGSGNIGAESDIWLGMGIHPKSEQNGPEYDYDIDIGVMQGYRLYAISCTTDADSGMCKLKLFEAYLRARNMAGDQAHVGLVCMTAQNLNTKLVVGGRQGQGACFWPATSAKPVR